MDIPLAFLQLVSYVTLTIASIVAATVSAAIAYRSNFGWKPLTLIVSHGLQGQGDSKLYDFVLAFEVWNRRKYPIVIRRVTVEFSAIRLRRDYTAPYKPPWGQSANSMAHEGGITLAPSTQEASRLVAPIIEGTRLDYVYDVLNIAVTYFDPRKKKHVTLRIKYPFQLNPDIRLPLSTRVRLWLRKLNNEDDASFGT